jgi:group I intron endonuclease
MKIIGIYKLSWEGVEHFYIGQSIDIKKRFTSHKKTMIANKHKNIRVQRCYDKYGLPNFEIIEECLYEELNDKEQYYLDINFNKRGCCNLNSNAFSTKGYKYDEIALKSIREKKALIEYPKGENAHRFGKKHTEEAKQKLSVSRKGKKYPKLSEALKGRVISEEWRKKVSDGCKLGNAAKAKIVLDTQTGVYYSCAKEASDLYGINQFTFKAYLKNKFKTKQTRFIYA